MSKLPRLAVTLVLALAATAAAQESPRQLFEAGRYAETIAALPPEGARSPGQSHLAGLAYLRLEEVERAQAAFERLTAGEDDTAWTFVGRSALARLQGDREEAVRAAQQATARNVRLAQAQYQLGLAYYDRSQFRRAARAFAWAATLEPEMASAHYYAGMAYMRAERRDLMGAHFRRFVEVAPGAPERPAVESVLRRHGT